MTSKTIVLTGEEIRADYSGGMNAWLRNDGTTTVYASAAPGITAGADGVVSIPAGQAAAIYGACGSAYLLGTGSVQLVGSDYTACPFKTSTSSGGSGGVDDIARAAINQHAGNADIHVTADEKSAWDGLSNPNLLINPDSRINQRGLAAYHSSGYTVDRWKIVDATWCEPLSGGGMKITASENSSDIPARAVQVVENAAALAGKKCTISCEVLSTTAANSAIYLAMYNSGGKGTYKGKTGLSAGINQYTADIPADTTALQVWLIGADTRVGDEAGMYTEFTWSKLEVGNSATPFLPPDPAEELLKCQRYFVRYGTAYGWFGTGFTSATNRARLSQALPVPLRSGVTRPTVTVHGTLYIDTPTKLGADALALGDFIDSPLIQNNNLCMGFVIPDGTGAVEPCYGQIRDADSYIDISAEL